LLVRLARRVHSALKKKTEYDVKKNPARFFVGGVFLLPFNDNMVAVAATDG
jgi:hypothetical protein